MSDTPEKNEGEGEPQPSRSDLRMLSRAVRERWPVPGESREAITAQLVRAAKGSGRAAATAARTLARMDALNQADEHADRHYERIDSDKPTELVRYDGVAFDVPSVPERMKAGSNGKH